MIKKRIDYLDVAKGLCMILVVMVHTNVPEPFRALYTGNVILFFILSGYFFHYEEDSVTFILKKVRTLLVPFLVFYFFSYMIYYSLYLLYPSVLSYTKAEGILDCFIQKSYFNGPIWFLLSLFEIQLFVYIVRKLTHNNIYISWFMYVLLYFGGFYLSVKEYNLPLNLDSSMTCTIFFALGMLLKQWNLFDKIDRLNRFSCLALGLLLYLLFLYWPVNCMVSYNRYLCSNSFQLFVMLSIICVAKILFCKVVSFDKIPLFKFIGKHTLFILCTHHLIYRPVKLFCNYLSLSDVLISYIVFIVTMIICLITATWFERKFPWAFGLQTK